MTEDEFDRRVLAVVSRHSPHGGALSALAFDCMLESPPSQAVTGPAHSTEWALTIDRVNLALQRLEAKELVQSMPGYGELATRYSAVNILERIAEVSE